MERGDGLTLPMLSYFLWSFTPDGKGAGDWSLDQSLLRRAGASCNFWLGFHGVYDSFYSLGGAVHRSINATSEPPNPYGFAASEGLISYDFVSNSWANSSSIIGSRAGYSVQVQAVVMPDFGEAGLLAFFGGDSPPKPDLRV